MRHEHSSPVPALSFRWAERWDQTREWLSLGMVFVPMGEMLLKCYSEPGRYYHDGRHVLNCLNALDKFLGHIRAQDAIELALWFHDAIYDVHAGPGENEAKSARLFRREFEMLAGDLVDIEEVCRLIVATRHHAEPEDADAALIMDIDLGILGADRVRYDAYAEDIRKEYAHVDDEAFGKGRAEVLRSFLRRRSIYWTRHFRKLLEDQARSNVERELSALTQTGHNRPAGDAS